MPFRRRAHRTIKTTQVDSVENFICWIGGTNTARLGLIVDRISTVQTPVSKSQIAGFINLDPTNTTSTKT